MEISPEKFLALRKRLLLTQQEMAERTGLSYATIRAIESAKSKKSIQTKKFREMAEKLKIHPDLLLLDLATDDEMGLTNNRNVYVSGKRINAARGRRGLSVEEFARMIDADPHQVRTWGEHDIGYMPRGMFELVVAAVGDHSDQGFLVAAGEQDEPGFFAPSLLQRELEKRVEAASERNVGGASPAMDIEAIATGIESMGEEAVAQVVIRLGGKLVKKAAKKRPKGI